MIDMLGQQCGRWTVIAFNGVDPKRRAHWTCRCQCGIIKVVVGESLRLGSSKSCGCLVADTNRQLNSLPLCILYVNRKLNVYRRSARDRGHAWELTREQFVVLISSCCYYCGATEHSGIDRVNNSLGYTVENSRPCCKVCNYAKNTMSVQDFFAWIDRIYQLHRQRKVATISE